MKIIPVIDLKDGVVVHAKLGQRDHYQAIHTPLCASADVHDVIAAFLSIYPFDTFYIADLNAITGLGNHQALIANVLAKHPKRQFWLDCGYQREYPYPAHALPVLGSESYNDDNVCELKSLDKRFVLSLDFSGNTALGAKSVFTNPAYWPDTVIIMTLHRVGSHLGPDLDKLSAYSQAYPDRQFVAAGGVRNTADLHALRALGIHQALLASALHAKAISAEEIRALSMP